MEDKAEVPYETGGKCKINIFVSIFRFTARKRRKTAAVDTSLQTN
jgi:hypothetical protein